jgi:hypothetical protein
MDVLTGIAGLLAGAGLASAFRPKVKRVHQLLIAAQDDIERGRCDRARRRIGCVEKAMFDLEAKDSGQANTMGVIMSAYEGTRDELNRSCSAGLRGFVTKHGPRRFCVHNEPTGRIIVAKGKQRCYPTRTKANKVWHRLDCRYTGRHCEKVRT